MTDGTEQHNPAQSIDNLPVYRGEVYLAQSGEFAFRVYENNELYVAGSGFEDEIEAADACTASVPDVEFPVLWVSEIVFATSPRPPVVAAVNQLLQSYADYFFKNPDDTMDADGVLELLSNIHDTLNGVSNDDDEVVE